MLTLLLGFLVSCASGVLLFLARRDLRRSLALPALAFCLLVLSVVCYSYRKAGQWTRVAGERLLSRHAVDVKTTGVRRVAEHYVLYVQTKQGFFRKKLPVECTALKRCKGGAACAEAYEKVVVDDPDAGPVFPLWYFRMRRGRKAEFSHYVLVLPESVAVEGRGSIRR
ncbi:MAG: hypothetical protein ACYTFZ_07095 [Planctomycetota bacterium]|jgi:hypothetical protein